MSPRDIALLLNEEKVTGPRGRKWRDTAIRGHVGRGTGILNNESYIGRMVWNRRQYRKNPQTEKRTARANDASEWVLAEVPQMRIISDELWSRVKDRQKEIGELFDFGQSNRLNATHRPEYLLSQLLECEECGGPYAISGKDRYSCTNRKKRLPIDELGGACCSNSKTIIRQELECRVLDCLPAAFFAGGIFDTLSEQIIAHETAKLKRPLADRDQMKRKLLELEGKQQNIIQQISDRAAEGRPRLPALDDTLDRLEVERQTLEKEIASFTETGPDMTAKIEQLGRRHNPQETEMAMRQFMRMARKGTDEDAKRALMPIVRQLVQKVVIGKTPGHQPASLQVHGLIAAILTQMDVFDYMSSRFMSEVHEDFMERVEAGDIDSEEKKEMMLDIYREEFLERLPEWENLQMSVVAGAAAILSRKSLVFQSTRNPPSSIIPTRIPASHCRYFGESHRVLPNSRLFRRRGPILLHHPLSFSNTPNVHRSRSCRPGWGADLSRRFRINRTLLHIGRPRFSSRARAASPLAGVVRNILGYHRTIARPLEPEAVLL
ncbi:recombinase family protein [Brucella anthropi]|nr:recombinase family protein [Brucella anthropi]